MCRVGGGFGRGCGSLLYRATKQFMMMAPCFHCIPLGRRVDAFLSLFARSPPRSRSQDSVHHLQTPRHCRAFHPKTKLPTHARRFVHASNHSSCRPRQLNPFVQPLVARLLCGLRRRRSLWLRSRPLPCTAVIFLILVVIIVVRAASSASRSSNSQGLMPYIRPLGRSEGWEYLTSKQTLKHTCPRLAYSPSSSCLFWRVGEALECR